MNHNTLKEIHYGCPNTMGNENGIGRCQGKVRRTADLFGFFPAEEFIPSLMLGIAKVHFDHDLLEKALATLHMLQADYPVSAVIPEAIYLEGVSRYKHSHEPKTLKDAYEQLQVDFPSSEWNRRAEPYRLL